jgi:hypothetical protein
MSSVKKFGWIEFLTGFAAGSVVCILLTRKDLKRDFTNIQRKAEEIKNQLIAKAKNISSDLTERSQRFIEAAKNFAEGKYAGTIESLEKEYFSIKYAVNSAIDNYKSGVQKNNFNDEDDGLFIDFEDERLPKFIGMGRKKR